jgi:hypothetical protein
MALNDRPMRDGWWTEFEEDVLGCFDGGQAVPPADIAARLGVSEEAAISLLAMLAREGRVKIRLVSRVSERGEDGGRPARAGGSPAAGPARRARP